MFVLAKVTPELIHARTERYGDHPQFTLKGGDWVSLEFAVTVPVPEWDDQSVTIMREEAVLMTTNRMTEYLSGPQREFWVID